jgi:hypothetical protein
MELRIVKFANGMDVIADLSKYADDAQDDALTISDLKIPSVFTLLKPRILMMQQTPNGIQVGLAPFNIEDADDVIPVEVFRDKVVAMWRSMGVPCFQVAPGDF